MVIELDLVVEAQREFEGDIVRILFTSEQIQDRVQELAQKISEDYHSREPLVVGVLKGAIPFASDLAKNLPFLLQQEFMTASSYGSGTRSNENPAISMPFIDEVPGRHVLLIEDIVDTGNTMSEAFRVLLSKEPASLKLAALLSKPAGRKVDVNIDYQGFEIPNVFVVGYGLDFNQRYRNLPYIGVLKPELYTTPS